MRNILFYGLGKFVELYVFIPIRPTKRCERINVHDSTSKDESNPAMEKECSYDGNFY